MTALASGHHGYKMSFWRSLTAWIVWTLTFSCLQWGALSQTTLCSTKLTYGGVCVNHTMACPSGTTRYEAYSNYVGCGTVYQSCCAYTQGEVKNPGGVSVSPQSSTSVPPLSSTCGIGSLQLEDRILQGRETGPCDWPFAVSIRARRLDNTGPLTLDGTTAACAGVMIDRYHVLTNSPCIISAGNTAEEAPYKILVVAGEYNTSGVDIDPMTGRPQEQLHLVDRVFKHPSYEFFSQADIIPFTNLTGINSNALAIIRLKEPITGPCAGYACLPSVEEAANKCQAYDECVILGWGVVTQNFKEVDELRLGLTQLLSSKACDYITQKLGLVNNRPIGTACHSPRLGNTDGCLGDEGGAVLCRMNYRWTVAGILPFNLCQDDSFNPYVISTSTNLDWIKSIVSNY